MSCQQYSLSTYQWAVIYKQPLGQIGLDLISWWTLYKKYIQFKQSGYEPLKLEVDSSSAKQIFPEIWIARLPNWTQDKLKGWCFFSWHKIKDPFKIQVLTAR